MVRLFSAMLEDLPQGRGLERPLHPKRRRSLPPATVSNVNVSVWESSYGHPESLGVYDAGPSSPQIEGPETVPAPTTTAPSPVPYEVVPLVVSPAPVLVIPAVESPAEPPGSENLEVSSPAFGTSTPRTAGVSRSGTSTPRATGVSRSAKRSLIYNRPLGDQEINENLFYGSEEDSEEEDDQDIEGTPPLLIPRTFQVFLEEREDQAGSASELSAAGPPPSSTSGSADPASITPPVEPYSKFNFQWRAFPQPQVAPELRRESFSDSNCGPTAPYDTPYDAFVAIWNRKIMEHIVVETNRYAQQVAAIMIQSGTLHANSRITKWYDTTVDELYVFFAIIQATGVVVKTRIEEYWNINLDIFSTPEFTTAMRFDRFWLLSRCVHFQNNDACIPNTMTRPQAKLFKVQPLLDHLNFQFSHLYNMGQNIALDESLTMWKGWLEINQFIKNKAAVVGIKTYEVCESKTGYLWRFEVHAGHVETSNPEDPVSAFIPNLVLRLLDGLEHKGHTIWMDNFYNSPALARELKCRGFDCVGTLRTNRQFVPDEINALNKRDMAIGQVCGCTSGDVDLMVWRDRNRVALISTYHGLATTNCGNTLKPTVISDYNICMGGVDRKDQMLAMFPIERKRMTIWYKKLFRRLLNVSILNAYIMFKAGQSTTHRSFRKTLVRQLLSRHSTSQPRSVPTRTHGQADNTTQGFEHYPCQYVVSVNANKGNRYRRNCAECGKRVTTYCKGCNKALCAFTCFEPYHSKLYRDTAQ